MFPLPSSIGYPTLCLNPNSGASKNAERPAGGSYESTANAPFGRNRRATFLNAARASARDVAPSYLHSTRFASLFFF